MNDVFRNLYSEYLDDDEIYKLLFNTEAREDDFHKRPLSKLTYDILEQLKVVKNIKK